jgi:hypothetical protein
MFDWIRIWWYGTNNSLSHAARNAPNEGVGIKELIDNKPADVKIITAGELINKKNELKNLEEPKYMILSNEEILMQRNRLKKISSSEPVKLNTKPRTLMNEINEIMQTGNKTYFENLRKRREEKRDIIVNILEVKMGGFIEETKESCPKSISFSELRKIKTSALDDLQLI